MDWDKDILDKASVILDDYRNTPRWEKVVEFVDNSGVDYADWNDLDMINYYLEHKTNTVDTMYEMVTVLRSKGVPIVNTHSSGSVWSEGAIQITQSEQSYEGLFVTQDEDENWELVSRKDSGGEGYEDDLLYSGNEIDKMIEIIKDNV